MDKFRFFKKIPKKVKQAWREGWSDVKFFPNGFMTGCADFGGVIYSPGWYGTPPNELLRGPVMVCDTKGNEKESYMTLCGSMCSGG